jgi:hypothetical protein
VPPPSVIPAGGSVQQGLSAAGGALGFYQLGLTANNRFVILPTMHPLENSMLYRVALISVMLLSASKSHADPQLGGYWRHALTCGDYSKESNLTCGKGPLVYGPPDFFEIGILVRGHSVCGVVTSSSLLNHKLDTSYFVGSFERRYAAVTYGSSHAEESLRGSAQMKIRSNHLTWQVTQELGMGYMWQKATASKSTWPKGLKKQATQWCVKYWGNSAGAKEKDIDLRFD